MDTRVHPTEQPFRLAAVWTQTHTVPAPPEDGGRRRSSCADIGITGLK